jgi:hypothetical protein
LYPLWRSSDTFWLNVSFDLPFLSGILDLLGFGLTECTGADGHRLLVNLLEPGLYVLPVILNHRFGPVFEVRDSVLKVDRSFDGGGS